MLASPGAPASVLLGTMVSSFLLSHPDSQSQQCLQIPDCHPQPEHLSEHQRAATRLSSEQAKCSKHMTEGCLRLLCESRTAISSRHSVLVCALRKQRNGAVQIFMECWLNTTGSTPWLLHPDQCLHLAAPAATATEAMGAPALLQCLLKEVSAYRPMNTGQHLVMLSSSRNA